MQSVVNENPHGPCTAQGVRHAWEGFPSVGSRAVNPNLRIEGAVVQIDVVGDPHEFVVACEGVKAEAVDAGGEEAGIRFRPAGSGEIGENPMLADGRVPESDVVGDVADAEEAVAGAKESDAVAVAHERVVELNGGA